MFLKIKLSESIDFIKESMKSQSNKLENFITEMSKRQKQFLEDHEPSLSNTLGTKPTLTLEDREPSSSNTLGTKPTLILEDREPSPSSTLGTKPTLILEDREPSTGLTQTNPDTIPSSSSGNSTIHELLNQKSNMAFARFKTLFSTKFDSVIPPGDIYLTIPQLNKKYPDEMENITSNIYELIFLFVSALCKKYIFLKDYRVALPYSDPREICIESYLIRFVSARGFQIYR